MTEQLKYSGQNYWEDYHQTGIVMVRNREMKQERWLHPFIPVLQQHSVRTVMDLGCGAGYGALVLAGLGYEVSGCDISETAINHAKEKAREKGYSIDYKTSDIALPLPYKDRDFDAVICNLTLHMFPVDIARRIVREVHRCLAPSGLFAFHVNSTKDLPYRSKLQPPVVDLGGEMFCFGKGQTMRFFSEEACRDLLDGWQILLLQPVQMLRDDGTIQKCAWRCIAAKAA